MALDPRLFTTGKTTFPALRELNPLLRVNAGIPLDEALNQAGLLMDLVSTLADVMAHGDYKEPHSSNLAYTISLLASMSNNILSDVEVPVRQLCQGQHPLTTSQER